jgi:hypothetical protein
MDLTRERLVVTWATPDPDRLATRLSALGFAVSGRDRLVFPAGEVRLTHADANHEADRLLEPRWESGTPGAASGPVHPNAVGDVVALGWATVDADRAIAATQAGADRSFTRLPDDEHLGALVHASLTKKPATLVLEPVTEGRLAATLARGGEGPAAVYVAAGIGSLDRLAAAVRAAVGAPAAVRPGPLGPSLLLPLGAAWGPHVLVVAADAPAPQGRAAGTITP